MSKVVTTTIDFRVGSANLRIQTEENEVVRVDQGLRI